MTMAGSEKIWNGAKTDFLRPLILSVPLGPEARSQKKGCFSFDQKFGNFRMGANGKKISLGKDPDNPKKLNF